MIEKGKIEREQAEDTVCDMLEANASVKEINQYFKKNLDAVLWKCEDCDLRFRYAVFNSEAKDPANQFRVPKNADDLKEAVVICSDDEVQWFMPEPEDDLCEECRRKLRKIEMQGLIRSGAFK